MEQKKQEKSVRVQTSILNPIEKKILVWLAERMPSFIVSDHLTAFAVFGSFIIGLGYFLTSIHPAFFCLASLGFVFNWFGDSLDGTIARVRKTQRPKYGFFLDHNVDCICELMMVVGAGMSPYVSMWIALLLVIPYMMLEVSVMINAHLKDEFLLTYSKLGPTEFRVILIAINTIFWLCDSIREWSYSVDIMNNHFTIHGMDTVVLAMTVILFFTYLQTFWSDIKYYAKIDPLKKS